MDKHKDALLILGYVYVLNHKFKKAKVLLEGIQVMFPEDADIAKMLAYVYLKLENSKQSTLQLEKYRKYATKQTTFTQQIFNLLKKRVALCIKRTSRMHQINEI